MERKRLKPLSACLLALLLAACGGGAPSDTDTTDNNSSAPHLRTAAAVVSNGVTTGTLFTSDAAATATGPALTPAQASQFLAQASFGPTDDSIKQVISSGKAEWITAQFQKPQVSHRTYVQLATAALATGSKVSQNQVLESFWKQAINGDDQLRQRVTYALSQIFVISMVDGNVAGHPAGVASYYDMLAKYSFGNFRDLLQGVALHPMMGIYLSHMRNRAEIGATSLPDENFAREVMQLMTIGLYKLNPDGGYHTINGGKLVETYTHADVAGLAKVFTGWSWNGPDSSTQRFFGAKADPERDWKPMQMYQVFHSSETKSFLGATTAAGATGEADLKVALDTLFNHPNVGPFIGRQLIQRLVSSNPSPAYISRVSAAFANNGAGVRGDMRAVIRAILLDPEAVDTGSAKKLREPVLRLAHWMRSFNAKSTSGRYLITSLDDPLNGLGQTPLRSPSVFNFYRPGYTPPNTTLSAAGRMAPEMQITAEPSVTGYLNYMQTAIQSGVGTGRDVQANYANELALVAAPDKLVDRVNLLLLSGTMSTTLRNQIITAINSVPLPAANGSNAALVDTARKNRVYLAVFLAMASTEYLAQR